eukprot:TRINITY_DN31588_c0_g1_i1.p1 TRINITY_DN31588_c0_g1~~TRINITY_DN31588_c0_g1_i1.p1  ORF type:complete len:544 (+),score=165.16 TRINITY_DN31588_c0_g1_i1:211-1842(+)
MDNSKTFGLFLILMAVCMYFNVSDAIWSVISNNKKLAILIPNGIVACFVIIVVKVDYKQVVGNLFYKLYSNTVARLDSRMDLNTQIHKELKQSLKKTLVNRESILELPKKKMEQSAIMNLATQFLSKENKFWVDGKVSGAVYHGGEEHVKFLNEVYSAFHVSNPLHADLWPSVCQMEAECIAMVGALFDNDGQVEVAGSVTSGGTESIIMSVKTHRDRARDLFDITKPEMIIPATAHAAFDKACNLMNIKLIKVEVNSETGQVDPNVIESKINGNTIMIVGSACNYPHGIIDPIEELSAIAVRHNIGLHVDCCLGGFMIAFAENMDPFDFRLPGVTALSCDTHKYGYAPKGTSVVLYRSADIRKYQYFTFTDWTGGLYGTPTIPGSRSGAVIAATWASLLKMGLEGYKQSAKAIINAREKACEGINTIPQLTIIGDPKLSVVAFRSDDIHIYEICDRMHAKGWHLNSLQNPAAAHLCITVPVVDHIDDFIADLRQAVDDCLSNTSKVKGSTSRIYGMVGSLPSAPVTDMVRAYIDVMLDPTMI